MGVIIMNQSSIYYIYIYGVYLVHLLERVTLFYNLCTQVIGFLVLRSGFLCFMFFFFC